jgi:ankyrin repeat protein
VFAALTVFLWPEAFQKNGELVASYAFPLFLIGTTVLTAGMFCCALLVEQFSRKHFFPLKPRSKVYWLQPGNQEVGEQVFGAFAGVLPDADDGTTQNIGCIRSVRCDSISDHEHHGRTAPLLASVSLTMLGFVIQFVGLRGLHASVTLAQLGATLAMAVVRTGLRTERMERKDNLLWEDRSLVSREKQELDWFSFHLQDVKSFHISSEFRNGYVTTNFPLEMMLIYLAISNDSQGMPCDMINRIVHTRVRLAEITSADWDGIPIRVIAHGLAWTIEETMRLISSWSNAEHRDSKFPILVEFQSGSSLSASQGEYRITVQPGEYHSGWKVNPFEVEAVLGLWIWSLLRNNPELQSANRDLVRLLGQDNENVERTILCYHKWIYRQTKPELVPSAEILKLSGTFGCGSSKPCDDTDQRTLVMKSGNGLNALAAQVIYAHFLYSALATLEDLGGDTEMLERTSQNTFVASNSRIEELATSFETNSLGSREDALACIVPVLTRRNILPKLDAYSFSVRQKVKRDVEEGRWVQAFAIIRWLCERSSEPEFENVVFYGYLCCQGMMDPAPEVRKSAFENIARVMQNNFHLRANPLDNTFLGSQSASDSTRSSLPSPPLPEQSTLWQHFAEQLGWLTWNIAKYWLDRSAQERLESCGITSDSLGAGELDGDGQLAQNAKEALVKLWFRLSDDHVVNCLAFDDPDGYQQRALDWVVQNGHDSLLQWLIIKISEVMLTNKSDYLHDVLFYAAARRYRRVIAILKRNGLDLDSYNSKGATALIDAVEKVDLLTIQELLENEVKVDGTSESNESPLSMAVAYGHLEIAEFLLGKGAAINHQNYQGHTPLMWAVLENQLESARLLLGNKADVERRCNDGSTALILAVGQGNNEIAELLLNESSANIDAQDGIGGTPLMAAVKIRNIQLVRLLLEKGAKADKRNVDGNTALTFAERIEFPEACSLLETALQHH